MISKRIPKKISHNRLQETCRQTYKQMDWGGRRGSKEDTVLKKLEKRGNGQTRVTLSSKNYYTVNCGEAVLQEAKTWYWAIVS